MNRLSIARGWGVIAAAVVLAFLSAPRGLAVPNVIVIVADDLAWHDLRVNGATDLLTPNLDALANEGVNFRHAYVTAPVCSPSRAGLLTGRYQQRFGHETNPGPTLEHSNFFGLPTTERTMGDRFRALGYATGWIGKSHLGWQPQYRPNQRGFDYFYGFLESHHDYVDANATPEWDHDPIRRNDEVVLPRNPPGPALPYLTTAFQNEALNFIEQHATQPFFLYLPFNAVHFELQGTEDLHERTKDLGLADGSQRRLLAEVLLGLDDAVGAIRQKLQQPIPGNPLNIEENTLIFFTSDNGGDVMFGGVNAPLKGRKTEVYEGGIRVPLIVHWKNHLNPAVLTAPVSTLDILPTAVAATGATIPAGWQLDGVNLLPYIQHPTTTPAPHESLFWRIETNGISSEEGGVLDGLRAMRSGDWKIVKPGANATWELYHIAVDESESTNLADSDPARLQDLIAQYEAWNAGLARPRWAVDDLFYPTPEFEVEDVRIGPSGVSFPGLEVTPDATQLALQDAGNNLLRADLEPFSGFPKTVPIAIDNNLASPAAARVVPQWGLSSAGPSLFYTKPGAFSHLQLWQTIPGAPVSLTSNPSADVFGARVSRNSADGAVKIAFTAGSTALWSTTAGGAASVIPFHAGGAENGQWIAATGDLAYAGSLAAVPGTQIARLQTATNTPVPITNELTGKADVWGFHAPEFDGEICYAAIVDRTAIGIYRDLHDSPNGFFTRVATLTLPASSPPRFLYNLRPVAGLRGFNGVSHFTCSAFANNDPQNPGTTEIWLLGAGPDPAHRVTRRLDAGSGADRFRPTTAIGNDEVFCYYTRYDGSTNGQVRLAKTGLQRPDRRGPSGFTALRYQSSFKAGENAQMRGTETTHLIPHAGKLYAGQGSVGNPALPPPLTAAWTGAQVLVKSSSTADWEVDHTFDDHKRVEAMEEITFTTRGAVPLDPPQKVLVLAMSDITAIGGNIVSVRARDDLTGIWNDSHPPNASGPGNPISFGSHVDASETVPVHHIYAGISNGELHRGYYAPATTGDIVWDTGAELSGVGPITGFAEANGLLYSACGVRQDAAGGPVSGGLYVRHDNTDSWLLVYRWPGPAPLHTAPAEQRVMTGLTAVRDPRGTERTVLIGARSWPGVIERIDPGKGHAVTVELDVRDFFARRWGDDSIRDEAIDIGYTRFTPAVDPVTGESVHLIGVWLEHPTSPNPPHNGSHFLIRHADATYEAADIEDFALEVPDGQSLRATRAIAVSPFVADGDFALYFGGYDATVGAAQDSAWIVRGEWASFPALTISRQHPPVIDLEWRTTSLDWILESSPTLVPANWQPVPAFPTRSLDRTTLSLPQQGPAGFFRLRRP